MNTVSATAEKSHERMSGNDYADVPVPSSARVTWRKLTFVWFGAAMVAQLYQGGVTVGTGMGSVSNALIAIFVGALCLSVLVMLNGIIGWSTGCSAALSGRYAYGSTGVVIPGFHIADIGWFVVMNAIFASILHTLFPQIDLRVYCILMSMLFITNNYVGFSQMVILNRVAFPILLLVGLYGIYRVDTLPGGLSGVFSNIYPETYSMTTAITMIIGTWVAGCSRAADYFRYAKRPRDAVISSFLGFFFGFSLCLICGAIWGGATGTVIVGDTLVMLNMVALGALMFFVQTWTTAEHSSYITSTALPTVIDVVFKKKVARRHIVLSVGIIGICITGLDIQNYYVPFISFLGYVLPVVAAITVTDFFILAKTNQHWTGHKDFYKFDVNSEEVTHHAFNWSVLPALGIGVLIGWKLEFGIPSLNAFFGSAIVYILSTLLLNTLGFQKKEAAKNRVVSPV